MSYLLNKFSTSIIFTLFLCFILVSCHDKSIQQNTLSQPAYEIYLPYWGPKNALIKLEDHADRLSNLQIKSIILSPLQPVSPLMKLGSLGSPFAITHFDSIRPMFGTEDDLKRLVNTMHQMGISVYMDWFPALMGRDNPLRTFSLGDADTLAFNPMKLPYTDVLAIDYDKEDVLKKMSDMIAHWVTEYQLDGIRIFHDDLVPQELYKEIKDKTSCVLIHRGQKTKEMNLFDLAMNTELQFLMSKIKKSEITPKSFIESWIDNYNQKDIFVNDVINYLNMSEISQIYNAHGSGIKLMTILNYIHHGTPIIPSGLEIPWSGNRNMLQANPLRFPGKMSDDFYRTLFILGNQNKALKANNRSPIRVIETSNPNVYGLEKKTDAHTVILLMNLSGDAQEFSPGENIFNINQYATKRAINIRKDQIVKLAGFQYIFLSNV